MVPVRSSGRACRLDGVRVPSALERDSGPFAARTFQCRSQTIEVNMSERISTQAAFCHACGAEAATGAAFCRACGTRLATIAVVAPAVGPSTNSQQAPMGAPNAESDGGPEPEAVDGAAIADDEVDDGDLPRDEWLEFDTPIRAAPRPDGPVMRQGVAGERVSVTGFENSYAVIDVRRRRGYVVQEAIGAKPPPLSTGLGRVHLPQSVRLAAETDVRAEPDAGGTVIFRGQSGESVHLVGAESGYARLDLDGVADFVPENAIDLSVASSAPRKVRARPVRRTYARQEAVALHDSAETPAGGGFRAVAPWIALIASLGMTGGALMRWSQNGFGSAASGTDWGQGNAIVVLGLVGVGLALSRGLGGRIILTSLAQLVVAIAGLWCGIYIARQIGDYCIENASGACIGEGGWLTMAAAVVLGIVSGVEVVMDLADGG